MIHYNSLWETMSNKHFTTYTLREKHNIGHGTVQRLQKNMPVSTYTLDRLCKILDCRLDEVAEYLPDEEAEKINKRGPGGGTSSPGGSFPHFFPRNGAPAGQAKVPFIWHHFPVDKIGD